MLPLTASTHYIPWTHRCGAMTFNHLESAPHLAYHVGREKLSFRPAHQHATGPCWAQPVVPTSSSYEQCIDLCHHFILSSWHNHAFLLRCLLIMFKSKWLVTFVQQSPCRIPNPNAESQIPLDSAAYPCNQTLKQLRHRLESKRYEECMGTLLRYQNYTTVRGSLAHNVTAFIIVYPITISIWLNDHHQPIPWNFNFRQKYSCCKLLL